jgi:hypothetical protein
MRSMVIGAAMMAMAAGPALAQGMPVGAGGQPGPGTILLVPAQSGAGGLPAQASGGQSNATGGQAGGQGGMEHGEGHEMAERMHHMEWMREHLAGDSFRFRRGSNEIDVHCGAAEPVGACVAAASALLDKLASMRPEDGNQGGQGGPATVGAPAQQK